MKKVIFFLTISILSGCNSSSNSTSAPNDPITRNEQISALESSGEIPTLDRSSNLEGVDSDMNGIREDIESYIETLAISEDQKKGVKQLARSVQGAILIDTTDDVALREASKNISEAVQCLSIKFPDVQERSEIINSIESKTANTKERTEQYIQFNNALSGSVSKLLSGDTCSE